VFEWDEAKAAANQLKHRVSFFEAAAFADLSGLDGADLDTRWSNRDGSGLACRTADASWWSLTR
jgi:hypothetical protein